MSNSSKTNSNNGNSTTIIRNSTFDNPMDVIKKQQQTIEKLKADLTNKQNEFEAIMKLLTAEETAHKELKALIEKQTEKQTLNKASQLPSCIDPRINNNTLPNDATLCMSYGARAYLSDVYPGYIWRNGYWFKITPALKFTQMPATKIKQKCARADTMVIHGRYNPEDNTPSTGTHVDDVHDALIINSVRVFARRVYYNQPVNGVNKFTHGYYANVYIPGNKHTINHQIDLDDAELEHSYIDGVL